VSDGPTIDLDAIDLDAIERDLADVERALDRLADGTYWSDDAVSDLATDPASDPAGPSDENPTSGPA
jgi:hypothetical protein